MLENRSYSISPLAESALQQMTPDERVEFLDKIRKGSPEKTPQEAAEGPSGLLQYTKDQLAAG